MQAQQWNKALLILIASSCAVLVTTPTAFAGHHGKHHKHQCPSYSDIDADGNNAVTAEEFYAFRAKRMAARAEAGGKMKNAKNAPAFEDLDLDGDGNLSADEFAEHHAQCPMRKKDKAESPDEA